MRFLPWLCSGMLILCASPLARSLANDLVAVAQPSQPDRERVLIIVRDDCPKCDAQLQKLRAPGGTFDLLKAKGWVIGAESSAHIQIVNQKAVPELVKSLGDQDYPAIAGFDGREVTRYFKSGCTTPLDPWTFGWLLTGKNERPTEPVSEPALVASTGNYRLRGNHWSVEGDFNPSREKTLAHLYGANHANSSAAYGKIDTWSLEELRSLHDDLHEREGGLSSGVGRSTSSRSSSSRPAYLSPKTLR